MLLRFLFAQHFIAAVSTYGGAPVVSRVPPLALDHRGRLIQQWTAARLACLQGNAVDSAENFGNRSACKMKPRHSFELSQNSMLSWAYFPRCDKPTPLIRAVVSAFQESHDLITSDAHSLQSNAVLAHVAPRLAELGFSVEVGKKRDDKVRVPVLYGNNGKIAKSFEADAYHVEGKVVVEVEAGRAVANNQFLKDLFQACMMDEVDYLTIAVRNSYEAAGKKNRDFASVETFFETMYASNRMKLPLRGILLIGY